MSAAPLRSSLADVAWAVEDRVVLGGADLLRGIVDIVRWPFERIAWAVEQWLVWPLEERAGGWNPALRAAAVALVAVAAVGAGVAGLLLVAPGNDGDSGGRQAATGLPFAAQPPPEPKAAAAPTLKGTAPIFKPEADEGVSEVAGGEAVSAGATPADAGASKPATRPPAITAPGGPAAMKVARRFAAAFVLYETGRGGEKVRAVFRETATPRLSRSLLRRPPRLPANGKVPKAKVLNVVPGPRLGGIFTVSASLLRVGVTSELRIDLEKTENGPRVTSVLG